VASSVANDVTMRMTS